MTTYELAKSQLLDYYVEQQLKGNITEQEMEDKMDLLETMSHHKVIQSHKRLKLGRKQWQE